MPSGASSAVLAPETGRSDRIHQLLDRLARSVAETRTSVESEVVAAPSFVGDMAALARTARAAAEDAAAAAETLAYGQAAAAPEKPSSIAPKLAVTAPEPAPAPAETAPTNDPVWNASPELEIALPAPLPLAVAPPEPDPVAVQPIGPLDLADAPLDLPGEVDLAQDIVLHAPFAFSLVDSHGAAIDHGFVRVDAQTGQLWPRPDAQKPATAFTANVQICDALGVRLIERVELTPDFFTLAQAAAARPTEIQSTDSPGPLATKADETIDVLVIDELGPVEADFGAYLTTGADGVVQLIRLPEQEQNAQQIDIIVVDPPFSALTKASQWRTALNDRLGAIPVDALRIGAPAQRPFPRTVYNPFRNAGTSRIVVRLECADLRQAQAPNRLIVSRT